jgi:hypothetical protein
MECHVTSVVKTPGTSHQTWPFILGREQSLSSGGDILGIGQFTVLMVLGFGYKLKKPRSNQLQKGWGLMSAYAWIHLGAQVMVLGLSISLSVGHLKKGFLYLEGKMTASAQIHILPR